MHVNRTALFFIFFLAAVIFCNSAFAQFNRLNQLSGSLQNGNQNTERRPGKNAQSKDSLKLRDVNEDSITVTYKLFDSATTHHVDTTINDFNSRLQLPFTYTNLGNIGSPAQPLLFNPYMQAGWDAGFHSMDPYKFTVENTKIYTTTRPYTVLGYMLGQKGEQYIDVLHTQPRAHGNANATFEYRLLNAPGEFKNQNSANNNIRLNVAVTSKNKRYGLNFMVIRNSLKAATNGGLQSDDELTNVALGQLSAAHVKLGDNNYSSSDPFNAKVTTGNIFSDVTLFLRQSYDFGQKDSVVKDTITYRLFYPRLRLEHTIKYTSYKYDYVDYSPDAQDYQQFYNFIIPADSVKYEDKWNALTNEFAVYLFPVKKNSNQYLKLYGDYQIINGVLGAYQQKLNNIFVGANYRIRTPNQKWFVDAGGQFYIAAKNYAGNYDAHIDLRRDLGKKIGSIEIGFRNVNQTPGYIFSMSASSSLSIGDTSKTNYSPHSSFPVITDNSFKNQNISRLYATISLPALNMQLTGNYFLYTNYIYFTDFFTAKQSSSPFNILQIGAEKTTNLGKHFRWYVEGYAQPSTTNVPVHVPFFIMRNRIAFEGNFFKNLYIATGLDVRYVSSYKPDIYSPFTGQFVYQDSATIHNRPDIAFYLNFRITRFKFFAEYSGLNTMNYSKGKFGFNRFNFVAPEYPAFGTWLRIGVWWTFIN